VKSQLYRALDRDYIEKSEFNRLYALSNEVSRLINGLINYLKKSEKSGFKFNN
jgi:four helix bundle protein